MDYQDTIDYLYSKLPVFQNIGARAFKPGLQTIRDLCESLGNPQEQYPTIHVAGTNGKGSTSHMIAAILQTAGYKVGLYTSPHLKDFRERIRVDGQKVSERFIVDFTADQQSNIEKLNPSFFEVTVAMALSYFQVLEVDVAVIEVGMGGRLDSTNIVTPVLSLITNISLDHTQFLGETLAEIAGEKAGIIKQGIPVIISELQSTDIANVFIEKAIELNASLTFASDLYEVTDLGIHKGLMKLNVEARRSKDISWPDLNLDLGGAYQRKNICGVLCAIEVLKSRGYQIPTSAVYQALSSVTKLTGLLGRWQLLQVSPTVYCDTAHNISGLTDTIKQFLTIPASQRRFVIGFVGDKDISGILKLFPKNAFYYFCQPSNARALMASELTEFALANGLEGETYENVNEALKRAITDSTVNDAIYVGGSTFVVADLEQLL
ncbi:bifunctional folylpolyglutamate synthase/dihydrofolate synthase [Dyadobacter arcticus]|uniref:Dihydrofolate synthase/folylpolyglutamate synthase n=1 Tax=Dyadobacter arcticus TaxID=1078754 RepID=A0ABX0UMK4_9BACT|nr:folylpolyglutamate synthase/dihydrofolate synthase family protein [Dyadobacter arcticus]NIJ54132.1 dihydrofolate synthase/folylpolyglutamate synthase [Dyadobacter arcticus]